MVPLLCWQSVNVELEGQNCNKGFLVNMINTSSIVRVILAYFVDVYVVRIFRFD